MIYFYFQTYSLSSLNNHTTLDLSTYFPTLFIMYYLLIVNNFLFVKPFIICCNI